MFDSGGGGGAAGRWNYIVIRKKTGHLRLTEQKIGADSDNESEMERKLRYVG